jgi:hypothetical protein
LENALLFVNNTTLEHYTAFCLMRVNCCFVI